MAGALAVRMADRDDDPSDELPTVPEKLLAKISGGVKRNPPPRTPELTQAAIDALLSGKHRR